ncbi:MAG: PQQ-like beta-propeller repeat protein [Deltaproteobacteria bacterium]|nr:PQQ-like beta-propeller repeat protein [Deltaproteobacteria bacterium]
MGRIARKMHGDTFKIVIGDGWRAGGTNAAERVQNRRIEPLDLGRVRDVVDIVVGGASIFGKSEEDSIFFLVRDMLCAVESLVGGDGTARVSYYEGPYELVIQRLGARAYLTFYKGGAVPEVVVKDQTVVFGELVNGVLLSAADLETRTLGLDPSLADDPILMSIHAARERLATDAVEPATLGPGPRRPENVESTRWRRPRSEEGFSFGFRLRAGPTDLLGAGRALASDLNALLFRGQIVVHGRGRHLTFGEGFLFLQVERLLASVRQLLSAYEEGRPTSVRLVSDTLSVGLKLAADDGLTSTFSDRGDADAILVLADVSPWEYADAVLGVARELRRLVVETSPAQRQNLRLEMMSREVKALAGWLKDQRRCTVINRDTERYRRLAEPRRTRQPSGPTLGDASRLMFTERWHVEVEGLDMDGTVLCGNLAVVSARGCLLGVSTMSGGVAWRRETDRTEARVQIAGQDGLVRVAPSGQVDLIDVPSGVLRWRVSLSPRSGGAPVVLVADHGPAPGVIVVAEEDRRLVALDLRTGEPRWRFSASRGGRFALRRHGRLLYVAVGDNQLHAVDLENGSLVWRFTDRTKFLVPPAVEGDRLLACGGRPGRTDGRMYAIDPYSGELRWQTRLGGGALTTPIGNGGTAIVPVRIGRRHEICALDTATGDMLWRMPCDGFAESCALMALDDSLILNSAGGEIRSLGARDGVERWTTPLGPACSDDVPLSLRVVLRGGVLFVPADTVYVVRPEDGRIVQSMGGDAPVPDLLQVDPDLGVFVAEESGHIAMFGLKSRLSVVR